MKYIITAKGGDDVNSGNGLYAGGTPIQQTESATELIYNRLTAISYLKEGYIDFNTTVVTLKERKFLYENIFKNVEIYDSRKKYDNCIDLVTESKLNELVNPTTNKYKPFYHKFDRDKEEIFNIRYNKDIINSEFTDFMICIPRLKNSDTRRNLDQSYWGEFLKLAKSKYKNVFVFGKGNENLEDDQIKYVDTLQDYCSYLHHPNCVDIVSTISGPCHYGQFFGNSNFRTKMTMIDNLGLINMHGDDPSYFDPCVNFTKISIKFINTLVSPYELLLNL